MFTFSKPRYLAKRVHPITQKCETSYQFDVQYHGAMEEAPLAVLLDADTVFTVEHVEGAIREEQEWWVSFLQSFLSASASYFSRAYTAQHLQRILRHVLLPSSSTPPLVSVPQRVCCIPVVLELIGGQLLVHWKRETYPARIHIPDIEFDSDSTVSLPVTSAVEIEEWDADTVPEEQTTEVITDPAMLLERQRVKEARLRARLAVYRAQYQMNRFQEKYGQEVSDSDSDEDEEEDENEEEDL